MSIHIDAYSYSCTYGTNDNMQVKRHIIFNEVFIYHAHTFFAMSRACVGNFAHVSTPTHHELTIRALESELWMVSIDMLLRHICFGHDIMKDAQGQAFKVTFFSFTCVACTMTHFGHLRPCTCSHATDHISPLD